MSVQSRSGSTEAGPTLPSSNLPTDDKATSDGNAPSVETVEEIVKRLRRGGIFVRAHTSISDSEPEVVSSQNGVRYICYLQDGVYLWARPDGLTDKEAEPRTKALLENFDSFKVQPLENLPPRVGNGIVRNPTMKGRVPLT
jgi:hypothetical protein